MLIVFSGLPGTGKTTIARKLAAKAGTVYLRIDTIEQAIRNADVLSRDVGRSGYLVANELALSNLGLDHTVIVDCVNPVAESRQMWAEVAARAGVPIVNIQVICSDQTEHQRRVESRAVDVAGLTPPTWQSVVNHEYEAWVTAPFTLDTARMSAIDSVELIMAQLSCAVRA